MKKIYYSQEEAKQAVNEMMNNNSNYRVNTSSFEMDYDVEESESFSELVKDWAGEVAAYEILDENNETVAKFGYWDTESVELARARRDVYGAVATWNADPFNVEDDYLEGVAEFVIREDVEERTIREGELEDEDWTNLLALLDLEVGDTDVVHIFRSRESNETLTLCYSKDF